MCVREQSCMCVREQSCMCVREQSCMCVREQSCMCVRGIDFVSASTIFRSDFGTVPTLWYLLFFIYFIFSGVFRLLL